MKLHLGCGRKYLHGWHNLDIAVDPRADHPPDLLCDLRAIPLPDECATEALAIHVIEHVYRWETLAVLQEWRRLLKPGGLLVLELPNLIGCMKNIQAGLPDQKGMWGLYGNPEERNEFMCHRWGWTPETMEAELRSAGFVDVRHAKPTKHDKGKTGRDMRLEARR